MFLSLVVIYRKSGGTAVTENPPEPILETSAPQVTTPSNEKPIIDKPPIERPSIERPSRGKLIFVIDDAGNNLNDLEPFLHFPGPLTIAVLPGLPNSAEAANRIRAAGKEVFLHQPMESLGGHNPGPGAIFASMGEEEIRAIINRNLNELWPVSGMNNHEGSRVSMDERIMEIVLSICRERDIIFLDSRTTAETKAPAAAKRLGMDIGERDVFLDNEQDRSTIIRYINTGLEKAEQKGSALMIGHASTPVLAALLEEQYSSWMVQNYSLSTVSDHKPVKK